MKSPDLHIVTRLYDLTDLPCLDRLVFSVMAQADAGPLRLHVMLQRFSVIEVQAVREAIRELRKLQDQVSVTLHNWDYPAPFDLRVPLLNWGLEVAQGRYLMVLDAEDQLHPHVCATLLTRLRNTTAAIASGGTMLQFTRWWGDVMLPIADECAGTVTTPTFIIDRHRIATSDCVFRIGGETPADEFISRIGAAYEIDTRHSADILVTKQRFE